MVKDFYAYLEIYLEINISVSMCMEQGWKEARNESKR